MYDTDGYFFNRGYQPCQSQLDSMANIVGLMSFLLGLQNLKENEYQSVHTEQLIRQIDIEAANQKQTVKLLEALSEQFEEQNEMLTQILEELKTLNGRNVSENVHIEEHQ